MLTIILSVALLVSASFAAPNNRCIFLCDEPVQHAGYNQPLRVPQYTQPMVQVPQYTQTYAQPAYGGLGVTGGRIEDFGTVPVNSGRRYGFMNQVQPETSIGLDQSGTPGESMFSHSKTSFNHEASSGYIRYPVAPKSVIVQEPIRQYPAKICATAYTDPCY